MRIGVMLGADGRRGDLDGIVASAKQVESAGLDNLWMANIFSFDAIGTLAVVGREVPRIGLGTAVTPTYPRHPTALAQQALTTAAATGNRFTLGIGLSHKVVIENMLGFSYDKPARHMREYLDVLMPLLRGEAVDYDGEQYRVHGLQLAVPGADPVPTVVAALGPVMLRLAGEFTDGTNTWMVGPKTMENHIVKRLTSAAEAAGRPAPRGRRRCPDRTHEAAGRRAGEHRHHLGHVWPVAVLPGDAGPRGRRRARRHRHPGG